MRSEGCGRVTGEPVSCVAVARLGVLSVDAHHTEKIRVGWPDVDASGFMGVDAGLRYAEAAETGLRRRLGILADWADYPRRAVEADVRALPRFDDELEVRLRLDAIGKTSITWTWQIVRADELCIQGRHVVVHVDREERPEALPPNVRAALEAVLRRGA